MTPNGTPVRLQLTQEQAEILQRRYQTEDTGAAVLKLLMAAAGIWVLSEMIKKSTAKPARKKARP